MHLQNDEAVDPSESESDSWRGEAAYDAWQYDRSIIAKAFASLEATLSEIDAFRMMPKSWSRFGASRESYCITDSGVVLLVSYLKEVLQSKVQNGPSEIPD